MITIMLRCVALLYFLFAVQLHVSAQQHVADELTLTQLKAAEAYLRLNQVGEAKRIISAVPEIKQGWEWQLLHARLDRSVQTLATHTKPVVGIAVSNNGKYIATGSADNTIILWDASTFQVIRIIDKHKGQVTTLDFSPDGSMLVSGSTDKTLRLWSTADGSEIRNYNTHFKQGIYQVKFSNNGSMLGVVSWELSAGNTFPVVGFAKVLDVQTGTLIQRFNTDNHPASAVCFSINDKKLYTGTWGFMIKQHDIESGKTEWAFDMSAFNYYTAVQSIDLSPDNKFIVQGGKDNKIRMLNAHDGSMMYQIESWQGHQEWVNSVRFSPDGNLFASAGDDGLLKVWQTVSGTLVHTFRGHTTGINQVAWSSDGNTIFTTSSDNTVKVWHLNNPGERTFATGEAGPWCAPLSPDGQLVAPVNSDRHFALFDLTNGRKFLFLDSISANAAIFSSDGKLVAAGNNNIHLYETGSGKKIMTGRGHSRSIYGMDYSVSHRLFATAGDNTIRLWKAGDTAAYKTISTVSGAYAVKFSPDGESLFAGCTNGLVKIIATGTWTVTDSIQCGSTIFNMAISPDSKWLVTGGDKGEVYLVNAALKESREMKGHTKWVYGVAFHPTLPIAVTASYDKTIRIWDISHARNTLTLYGFQHELFTVSVSQDGKRLVITETDGLVHVINL